MKTTSFFQVIDLDTGYVSAGDAIVVRPPAFMRAFRCLIYGSLGGVGGGACDAYISTEANANVYTAIRITNDVNLISTNVAIPGNNQTTGINKTTQIQLDRRGVGYMNDTFYIFGKGLVNIVWEGEID